MLVFIYSTKFWCYRFAFFFGEPKKNFSTSSSRSLKRLASSRSPELSLLRGTDGIVIYLFVPVTIYPANAIEFVCLPLLFLLTEALPLRVFWDSDLSMLEELS